MSSRHLVDAEIAPALEVLPPFAGVGPDTLADLRATVDAAAQLQIDTADTTGVTVSERHVPGCSGAPDVRVVLYRPEAPDGPLPALLHLHGGGMVMGKPEIRHATLLATAREVGCLVVSVDYRLAPEAPFPAALHDAYAALSWLARQAAALGVDPSRLAIAGESAGGGLAAALALYARDRAEIPLVMQMLTYPMLDDRTAALAEAPAFAGEFVWGLAANQYGWRAFLGCEPGAPDVSPHAAPGRAEDLSGLPPAFIGVGALDLFLDENLAYAGRLVRAGVPTELHLYPGAFHAFDGVPGAAVAQAFKADWRRALSRAFAKS